MSTPWYAGFVEPWELGNSSPDPVTIASPSWSWDLQFDPVAGSLYARSTLNTFSLIGGGTGRCGGGIIEYAILNPEFQTMPRVNHVGQSADDGYADLIWDNYVCSVTFGWIVEADNYCRGRLNMEIWI